MNFQINLIKNRVLGFKKRRAVFLALIMYLAACALALVYLSNRVSDKFVSSARLRQEVMDLEHKFRQLQPKQADLLEYSSGVKTKTAQYIQKLEVIERVLSGRINLARLMQKFSEILPASAYINNLSLDSKKQALDFDVVLPEDAAAGNFNTSQLISAWQKDSTVMADIEYIKSSSSQRQKISGQSVAILKFSCSLAKGRL